jgi:hypothetical protein
MMTGIAPDLISAVRSHPAELLIFPDWPAERVLSWIDHQRERLFGMRPLNGEVCAVALDNDPAALMALLLIGASGGAALVWGPAATEAEQAALMQRAGATRRILPGETPRLTGGAGRPAAEPGSILLPTSGSTGEAKLVHRSAASLLVEGRRYVDMLHLAPGARILLPAPVVHAYALGWFAGCLLGGWTSVPLPPTALGQIAEELRRGADWAVMTPAVAKLLANRRRNGSSAEQRARCRVMVGAGPVTPELEASFREQFGIGLARNYGSTETGAILSGFEELPPGCVGPPMPGVTVRIVDDAGHDVAPEKPGILEVLTPDGWHSMGDLVVKDATGRVTILGRLTNAVRRGDQWIAPHEIERHLSAYPGLRMLRASKVNDVARGRERLALDVWPNDPTTFDAKGFAAFIEEKLQPAMRPDDIRVRTVLAESDSGKVKAGASWQLGPQGNLAAAARAYKRSDLLFALESVGVLERLDGRKTTDDIAGELGLDAGALEILLMLAARFGLVEPGGSARPSREVGAPIRLEAELSRHCVGREQFRALLRSGLQRRAVPAAFNGLAESYLDAMNGDLAAFRVQFGLRALGLRPGARLLELTAGPGLYGRGAKARGIDLSHTLWPLGPAASGCGSHAEPPAPPCNERPYDAIVLFNGLRWSPVPDRLAEMKSMISEEGTLLIDDLFLENDEASAEFALDWVTHGGAAFMTVPELTKMLGELGLHAEVLLVPGSAHARIVTGRHVNN